MISKMHKTVNCKGEIHFVERTQLDWDIEEARYEMKGRGKIKAQREDRQAARRHYKGNLEISIRRALAS